MSKFSEVLKTRNFFFLWIGQIISQIGDRLDQMALIAFVYSRSPGSALEIAKILSFTIIPVFLIGPIAGVYVDRWDRRRTMYACDFLRSALVLTIPLFLFYTKHLSFVYAIIFLIFCIGRFFVPAKLAIIPDLVEKKDLLIANSLVNTTGMIASVLGFGISGCIIEWVGAKSGFYLDSLSFLISGACIFLIAKKNVRMKMSVVSKEIVEVFKQSVQQKAVIQEIREGMVYFIKNREIRFVASIMFILWSALGAVYTVIIAFVQKTLHSATKDLGLLAMFVGIGLFVGSILYGKFGNRLSQYKTIFSSLIMSGIMLVIFSLGLQYYPRLLAAEVLALALGMVIAPIMIASNTVVHNASKVDMMGKVFSSLEIVMHLAFLVFMFASSMIAERLSCGIILISVGIIFSIVGAVNLVCNRKIPWFS
ncbi:MAG TPA: MFS transporter [Candidatus Omnitrophota bacterium]|nr:MFS transporter [Candidatus Omnitrophota bacterium]HPT07441.1 MFS transporter [Candidatus Omnitrophota bacterium]